VLGALRDHEDLPRAQAHGPLTAAIPQGDIELAVEYQEELIGVVVHMPDVLTPDMRDPDVVVVDPADDPRAVDVAEGGQRLAQADGVTVMPLSSQRAQTATGGGAGCRHRTADRADGTGAVSAQACCAASTLPGLTARPPTAPLSYYCGV